MKQLLWDDIQQQEDMDTGYSIKYVTLESGSDVKMRPLVERKSFLHETAHSKVSGLSWLLGNAFRKTFWHHMPSAI